jgi:DNA primase
MKVDLKALKQRADIVAVMQSLGVALKPKGTNFVALCPLHREKTPSFTVDPAKRIWKCFGCDTGGDIFKFVKIMSNLTLPQAIARVQTLTDGPEPVPPATAPTTTMASLDEDSIDRAPQVVLDRVTAHWQTNLARTAKAQAYLTARGLWHPELLRALRIGYCSGSLTRKLPGGGKLRRQLYEIGILNQRGTEFFYGRIVIPLYSDGVLVNVYGRAISPTSEVQHLYIKGPRRGVFNQVGVHNAQHVILTEAPLDALSLLVLGFTNVTTSYGAGGFTADLRAQLVRSKTERIYCVYDPDTAGDQGADQLAHDLAGHGIAVLRVALPSNCKDPNDFLKGGGTREQFQTFLAKASPMDARLSRTPQHRIEPTGAPTPAPEAQPPTPLVSAPPADDPTASPASSDGALVTPLAIPATSTPALATLTLGDRTYQLESMPEIARGSLRVILRATRQGRTFVDTLNLYADQARTKFVSRLVTVFRGQVPKKTLEEDFFAVLDEAETLSHRAVAPVTTPATAMTDTDRTEALAFLTRHDLTAQLLEDLVRLGVVGEDDNKLLAYLIATSRKLDRPLSLSVISGSSAGKSWLLNRVVDLMPAEDVLRFTRMSPRALFYDEPGRYKHKILHIEEAIGAKDADLGVRSMQSERRLANLATMTDPKTGKLKTQETVVEGPLTYMTSSVDPLDYETGTRSFEIAIDESSEQTGRIVARELAATALEAIRDRLAAESIVRRHQNAQRLIEQLVVVNPYARALTFPSNTLRLRREVHKYIGLMNTLALLFQYQRPIRTFTDDANREHRYVEVTREDIAIANRLMAQHLTRVLSDLSGTAQKLLLIIQEFVTEEAIARGMDPLAISFSRRQIRERLDWSDYQLNGSLEKLARLEYIEIAAGSFGKRYVYTLTPDHRLLVQAGLSIDERIVALGLTPAQSLKPPMAPDLSGSQSDLARIG